MGMSDTQDRRARASEAETFGSMQIGKRATIRLERIETYWVDVKMGVDEDPAVAAGEHVLSDTPSDDYETVHTEVVEAEPIYEDDPDAHEVATWIDAPSGPSDETYWDDSRHFREGDDGD